MNKNLLNLLYNPASLQVCQNPENGDGKTQAWSEYDHEALCVLEQLVQSTTESDAEVRISGFCETLSRPLSASVTGTLLVEFVGFITRSLEYFPRSKRLFQRSYQTLFAFKNLMDRHSASLMGQSEWVALEKALYQMSLWEAYLESGSGEALFDA